jgi:pyruvate,orthophosphate dikinase
MNSPRDICSLDYLIGTLATAYKGVITSLVVKDFCMSEKGDSASLKGTVLALPPGEYEARLIRSGIELSRSGLHQGYFELRAGNEQVENAQDLQIDIIQNGKHIGTFLLKREGGDGVYSSAIELSDELKGIDLKRLTGPLQGKIGLLQKAEDIISQILSAKKDWPTFSEKLHGFSLDVFWSVRDGFYAAFPVLAGFLRMAAERTGGSPTNKPASNFLDIVELPLEQESDTVMLGPIVEVWLREVGGSRMNLTPHFHRMVAILSSITGKFPDADIQPVLKYLLASVQVNIEKTPVLSQTTLSLLSDFIQSEDRVLLNTYAEKGRQNLVRSLAEAEQFAVKKDYPKAFHAIDGLDVGLFSDEKLVAVFFDVVNRSLTGEYAEPITAAVRDLFTRLPALSGSALERVKRNMPLILKKMIGFNRVEECLALLRQIKEAAPFLSEEITMDPGVALAVQEYGSEELVQGYNARLMQVMIPSAKVHGHSSESWAEIVNPLHLERLSAYLDILQFDKGFLYDVPAQVLANLYVSGVFIPDDKLFQRRISTYLNSGAVQRNIFLHYLLLKKLPVYFNDVGAASVIRDYSTEIDSWGNDPVLYFLRKQVHVNASNNNVRLIEEIMKSWIANDPPRLNNALPHDVFLGIKPSLFEQYSAVIRPFFESQRVLDDTGLHFDKLLAMPETAIEAIPLFSSDEIRSKVILLCKLYRETVKKYAFLSMDFDRRNLSSALSGVVERMKILNQTILSPDRTEAQESLYFKRHIAFGIPSVLGSYHEPKFDSFGELLRCDSTIGVILEEIIAEVSSKDALAARKDIATWIYSLKASYEVLVLHGLRNAQIDELIGIMEHNTLHLSQVADLLNIWQKELKWMVEVFNRTFLQPVQRILKQYPRNELPDTLMNLDPREKAFEYKAADIIIRDMINDVPGLVESDRLIEQLLRIIASCLEYGRDEELNAAVPREERNYFLLHEFSDSKAMTLAPLLGGKAKNLIYLKNRGFVVPAGVVFSSFHTSRYKAYTEGPEIGSHLKQAVKQIEEKTGSVFGGSEKPLFFSIRSGSYVSMPGILSSILYCGMNSRTIEALIRDTGDARLAWDAYRRFLEQYGTAVLGLEAGVFENIKADVMRRSGFEEEALSADDLQNITRLYQEALLQRGLQVPEDVYEQLRMSMRAVYASWFSERAESFKKAAAVSPYWGTAVSIMQMIYGNAAGSGASVFFTRKPLTHEPGIYGETKERAVGDDLVRGRQSNRPLAKNQANDGRTSLEEMDPDLFSLHQDLAKKIEGAMGGLPQEVEVVYTKGLDGKRVISVLQTRRMEYGNDVANIFDEICRMESRIIGRGIGAHGGAVSGAASFASSPEQAIQLQEKTGTPVILLRKTANTEDVSLMPTIRGIITASGGVTSHAAVLAQKFGVAAVVACSGLSITISGRGEPYATIGNTVIKEGTLISMDGTTGLVFSGICLSTRGEYRA